MTDRKGSVWTEVAHYAVNSVERFRGNPLIEALPDFIASNASDKQKGLASMPEPLVGERSRLQRAMWLIDAVPSLFVAEGRHVKLFEVMDMMIRHGYHCRRPDSPEHVKYLEDAYRRQQSGEGIIVKYGKRRSGPITAAVIGCSGAGKSMAVEEILRLYPQLIHHPGTESSDPFDQLVHLKIECPPDGSVKSLCKNILSEVDWITGLDYSGVYRVQYATESDLRKAVTQTLALHRTGLLVVDEMQNIVLSRKNHEELFNFIVSLANSLDVPLVNVGTPKVRTFMQQDLRIARRFGTWGVYEWSPLKFGEPEWKSFFDKIKCLYVLDRPMQEASIEKALFRYSQGIPGILVNLFVLAQMQAMVQKEERITVRRIRQTSEMYFTHVQPIVEAIYTDDIKALERYQDVRMTSSEFETVANSMLEMIEEDDDDDYAPDPASTEKPKATKPTAMTSSPPQTSQMGAMGKRMENPLRMARTAKLARKAKSIK